MKKFCLVTNWRKDPGLATTNTVKAYLEQHGAECAVTVSPVPKQEGEHYTNAACVPEGTQCVITLGGDGTLIQAARDLLGRDIPLMGINLGTLGYLAEADRDTMYVMLDHLLNEEYVLEKRFMLTGVEYNWQGERLHTDNALNDIVITRKNMLHVVKFNVYVNGKFLNKYAADGIIVATPTGSTAYNLSAGGPIVAPQASMIIMTPICAHALNARSIVFSREDHIAIEVSKNCEEEVAAIFDGNPGPALRAGGRIEIQKACRETTLVKLSNISFLENLRKKLAGV